MSDPLGPIPRFVGEFEGNTAVVHEIAERVARRGGVHVCGPEESGRTRVCAAAATLVGDVAWVDGAEATDADDLADIARRVCGLPDEGLATSVVFDEIGRWSAHTGRALFLDHAPWAHEIVKHWAERTAVVHVGAPAGLRIEPWEGPTARERLAALPGWVRPALDALGATAVPFTVPEAEAALTDLLDADVLDAVHALVRKGMCWGVGPRGTTSPRFVVPPRIRRLCAPVPRAVAAWSGIERAPDPAPDLAAEVRLAPVERVRAGDITGAIEAVHAGRGRWPSRAARAALHGDLALIHALSGDSEATREALAAARELGDWADAAVVEAAVAGRVVEGPYRRVLEFLTAIRAASHALHLGDVALAQRQRHDLGSPPSPPETPVGGLLTAWIAVESSRASRAGKTLLVAEDGTWFRPPGADAVDLFRRKNLSAILATLAAAHSTDPGAWVELPTLVAAAWPGEIIVEEAAKNRVYVALSALRKFGVDCIERRRGEGWRLDPTVAIELAAPGR